MAGFRVEGDVSGNVAEVNSNKELRVALQPELETAGYAVIASEIDDGSVTTTPLRLQPEISFDFRTRVGTDTILFDEIFPNTVLNSAIWTAPVTTMTLTVASGFATLNAGLSTASAAVARLTSYRSFPVYGTSQTHFESGIQFTQLPISSNVCEWGFGIASGTTAPTDGAFFRLDSSGQFRAVVSANGTEVQSGTLDFATLVGTNTTRNFIVSLANNTAVFWIDDVIVANISLSAAGYSITASGNLPILYRNYNSGATSAAQVMKVGYVNISLGDWSTNKLYAHQMTGAGRHSSMTQTGAASIAQTAVWANSANPTAAAPTNTTAALGSGLGGIFIANINGLAVTTDFIVSSFQVPAGTSAIPGKSLYVTGLKVTSVNTVVANGAGGPTTWAMALAYGHTAVSLATAEASTTKAPRRIPLGVQSLAASAAVGQNASPDISTMFSSPVVVQPGEFVQVIMRFVSNNSAATEALNFYIQFDGYFE